MADLSEPTCRECGCTTTDCSGCIERTGSACWWVEPDLCSACAHPDYDAREGRAFIRRWSAAYIALLRGMLKRAWPIRPSQRPPCDTCAFNPDTDSWPGFETTVTGLMFAIEGDKPFYCHKGHPRTPTGWRLDPATAQLCVGYEAAATDPDIKAAAAKAMRGIGRPPRGVTWDENRGITYPKEAQ